jgi:hypothetical protein
MEVEALRAYSRRLAKENLDDVLTALEKLGEMKRQEYESIIPELGAILGLVGVCAIARHNRQTIEAQKTTLRRWRCPRCRVTISGFTHPEDDRPRSCMGIPKDRHTDENSNGKRVCGAEMELIFKRDDFKCGGKYEAA